MKFEEIKFSSAVYKLSLKLRNRILREPLGLSLTTLDMNDEISQRHFGIFGDGNQLIGCVVVQNQPDPKCAKLRQMAIDLCYQRRGFGSFLLKETESWCHVQGIENLIVHARETAINFYSNMGFRVSSNIFIDVTIPHVKMTKAIGVVR